MTTSRSAALLRRWVALYTAGLPRDIRDARRAEIEDDLWSQAQEAEQLGASAADGASGDVLARLAFGLWADITWRLEQRHRARVRPPLRSLPMGTRIIAALAIIGGAALAVTMVIFAGVIMAAPDSTFETLDWSSVEVLAPLYAAMGAIVVLSIALWGLIFRFNDRIRGSVALVGSIGGFGGVLTAMGAFALLALLPVGSTLVAWDLSRFGALPRSVSITHMVSAVLFLLLVILGDNAARIFPWIVLGLWYPLTWIAIGVALLRGQPAVDKPIASGSAA
jgi:hypothetical protein